MQLAITSNGPGEFSGWVRPLVAALGRIAPQVQVTLFFVPDDYATGREPDVARAYFPDLAIVPSRDYVRFALGRDVAGAPKSADVVLYLGGDLLHAARVAARLGGVRASYKFGRRRGAASLARAYAVDERNADGLVRTGIPRERVEVVGNLAVDGALAEAAGELALEPGDDPRVAPDGVLIMPGARRNEVAALIPFYVAVCARLRSLAPALPVAFAISPFTAESEIEGALAAGGPANVWGMRGSLVREPDGLWVCPADGSAPIPIVRDAMRFANRARMVVTIPGTKCIELAALGIPTLVLAPTNVPEQIVINGPLQYIDRIPLLGIALKRAAVLAVDARFPLAAQPNIDAGEVVMPELRGTLMPGYVANRIVAYAADDAARAAASTRLRALYAHHAGAAGRMASSLAALAP
jgi:lipid-A-disaccharide synthase